MDAGPITEGNRYQYLRRAVIVLVLVFLGATAWASPDISISAPAVVVQGEALPLEVALGTVAGNGSVPVDVTVRCFPADSPDQRPKARYHARQTVALKRNGRTRLTIPGNTFNAPGRYLITVVSDSQPDAAGYVEVRVAGSSLNKNDSPRLTPPADDTERQNHGSNADSRFDAWIAEGRTHTANKQFDRAIVLFDRVLNVRPNHVRALYERGRAQYKAKRRETAFADFNRVLEIDPDYEDALYYRAICHREQGAYERAIADASHAIRVNPDASWNYFERGNIYSKLGRTTKNNNAAREKYYRTAIEDFTHAIQYDHENIEEAYNNRGVVYQYMGQYQKAIADHTRAIDIKNDMASPYSNRAYCHRQMKAYQKSLVDYNRALSLDPQRIADHAGRGCVYRLLKHYDTAIADLTWAIEHNVRESWVYANRGACYLAKKDFQAAIRDYSMAIEKNRRYEWAIANRGQAYLNSGNPKLALADFERAAALNPNDAWNLAHRGEAHRKLGNRKAAVRDFKQALKQDPGYAWAKNRLETIESR